MSIIDEKHVKVKLFIGYPMNAELKLLLDQSSQWKQDKITRYRNPESLVETHYQDKDYIGRFFFEEKLTMAQFKQLELDIKTKVQVYCPNFNTDRLKIFIFPQVFVT